MELFELLDFARDYKNYNDSNYYSLREFLEVIEDWNTEQIHIFERFKDEIDFTRLTNLIEYQEYIIYENIKDYIYDYLREENCNIPSCVCIDIYYTWFTNLRYADELYFLKELPKWAEDGEEYGSQDKKDLWREGKKWLIENSEVIWLYD